MNSLGEFLLFKTRLKLELKKIVLSTRLKTLPQFVEICCTYHLFLLNCQIRFRSHLQSHLLHSHLVLPLTTSWSSCADVKAVPILDLLACVHNNIKTKKTSSPCMTYKTSYCFKVCTHSLRTLEFCAKSDVIALSSCQYM